MNWNMLGDLTDRAGGNRLKGALCCHLRQPSPELTSPYQSRT